VKAYCPETPLSIEGRFTEDIFQYAMAIVEPCEEYADEFARKYPGRTCAEANATQALFCTSPEHCLGAYGTAALYVKDRRNLDFAHWISPLYVSLEPHNWMGIETIYRPVRATTTNIYGTSSKPVDFVRFGSWYTRRSPSASKKDFFKFYLKLDNEMEYQVSAHYGWADVFTRVGANWTNICLTVGALALAYNKAKAKVGRGGGGGGPGRDGVGHALWSAPTTAVERPSTNTVTVSRADAKALDRLEAGVLTTTTTMHGRGDYICPDCTATSDLSTLAVEQRTGKVVCGVCRQVCPDYGATGTCKWGKECRFEHVRVVSPGAAGATGGRRHGTAAVTPCCSVGTVESESKLQPPAVAAAALGPLAATSDVCFCFDTTGSMSTQLDEIRSHIESSMARLFAASKLVRVAVIAHGDYVDERHSYACKSLNFSRDKAAIANFIRRECTQTGGGSVDDGEAYELALRHAAERLDWRGSHRSLVLIGDDRPHGVDYPGNNGRVDWRHEVSNVLVGRLGVVVHAVQVFSRPEANGFWPELAKLGGGEYLQLHKAGGGGGGGGGGGSKTSVGSDLSQKRLATLFTAICMSHASPAALRSFEKFVRHTQGGNLTEETRTWFTLLARASNKAAAPVAAVAASTVAMLRR